MNASTTVSIFDTFVSDIGAVLGTSLPVVLAVAAALVGLGIVIRYVKRWVGRK